MSLWKSANTANNAPKHSVLINKSANGESQFGNTSIGVFGVTTGTASKTHSGWVLRKTGSGFLTGLTITTAGSGYANGSVVTVSGGGATSNATAVITTNGSGAITTISDLTPGAGFRSTPTVAIAGTGSLAVLTPTMGGRYGRINDEVLVALGSMTS